MADEIRQGMAKKLERDEFAAMVANGRGLAMMHALEYDLDDVLDLVISACTTAQGYDPQCEAQRAPWLFRMIRQSKKRQQIVAAIIAALPRGTEFWDITQMCELAAMLGRDGDVLAGAALRDFVLGQDFSQDTQKLGCCALVMLDGMPAVEQLARRFGALLIRVPQAWPDTVETLTDGTLDAADTLIALGKSAVGDAELSAFVQYCKDQIEKRERYDAEVSEDERRARRRLASPAAKVFAAAETDTRLNKGYYRNFGRFATTEELEQSLQRLIVSVKPDVCTRLLWIFMAAKMPRLEAKIFELSRHKDAELRYAALAVLSTFSDSSVRDVGLAWLASASPAAAGDASMLRLFVRNYRDGDELLILTALERLGALTEEAGHIISCNLVEVIEESQSATVAVLADWVYTTSRCAVCRRRAVKRLVALAGLPDTIAQECLYDADPATQLLAGSGMTEGSLL